MEGSCDRSVEVDSPPPYSSIEREPTATAAVQPIAIGAAEPPGGSDSPPAYSSVERGPTATATVQPMGDGPPAVEDDSDSPPPYNPPPLPFQSIWIHSRGVTLAGTSTQRDVRTNTQRARHVRVTQRRVRENRERVVRMTTSIKAMSIGIMITSILCVNPIAITFAVIALVIGQEYKRKVTRQCDSVTL